MPSKHISSVVGDTEQHVSYHFDTIQEMIEFERFLQENTFEKYHKDQEIAFDVTEAAIKKSLVLPESYGEITSYEVKSCPWIIDWEKLEEEIGSEYKWFAVDEDERMWVYTVPVKADIFHGTYGYDVIDGTQTLHRVTEDYILQEGTVPWSESLVKKPEKN